MDEITTPFDEFEHASGIATVFRRGILARCLQAALRAVSFSALWLAILTAGFLVVRRAWPLVDLQPDRKAVQLSRHLPRRCRCAELQLSREPTDLLRLLDGVRPRHAVPVARQYPALAA